MNLWSALNAPFPDVREFWRRLWAPEPAATEPERDACPPWQNVEPPAPHPMCRRCGALIYGRGPWLFGLPPESQPHRNIWCDCPDGDPTE